MAKRSDFPSFHIYTSYLSFVLILFRLDSDVIDLCVLTELLLLFITIENYFCLNFTELIDKLPDLKFFKIKSKQNYLLRTLCTRCHLCLMINLNNLDLPQV